MGLHYPASKSEYPRLNTAEIRENYLMDHLFERGEINYSACETDRVIIGSACPTDSPLHLEANDDLKSDYFCERRELGVLNIGGAGRVLVDEKPYEIGNLECLYVGRGSEKVVFESRSGESPQFYLISYPAHAVYPTQKATLGDANRIELGAGSSANERVIYQYIHQDGIQSCQLVMGFTELKEGSVWNTMPPHTHARRSEVYLYFDIPEDNLVFHFMGEPQETRHIAVRNRQIVLSPSWSIHSGCGTSNYRFVWSMGGENQRFDDMDAAPIPEIK